jgi:two-component system cell cycle sensor histidine kinase/response regulator CckA
VNIYLPVENEEAGNKNRYVEGQESHQYIDTKKVLLMDDEKMIRTLAVGMFGRLGYEVDLAEEGQEAIELYSSLLNEGKRYMVVILDLMVVEGMGGRQAIDKLLEIDGDARAVVSSGYSGDPVITNYKSYGFCGSLTKPYTSMQIEELFERLQIGESGSL